MEVEGSSPGRTEAYGMCGQEDMRQLPSIFCATWRHLSTSVNFQCGQKLSDNSDCILETFSKLPSTFCVARSTLVNFLCSHKTFRQLSSTFNAARRLPLPSINFRAVGRPSINFRQILVQLGDLLSISVNLLTVRRPSFNLCQLSVRPGNFQ